MTAQSSYNTSETENFYSAQIEAALTNFLENLSHHNSSSATIRNYRSDIKQFYKYSQLTEIKELFSKAALKDFILSQKEKGLKDSSVTRKIASITQFALWSKQQGIISNDVSWMTQVTIESLLKFNPINIPNPPAPNKEPQPNFAKKDSIEPKIKNRPDFLKIFGRNKNQTKTKDNPIREDKTNNINIIGKFSHAKNAKKKKPAQSASNFILPYLNLGLIVLFFIGLGFLGYNQLVIEAPTSLAFPSSPVTASRVLSFQGRLTDTAQNPITTATNMEFKIWSLLSGGTEGTCDGTNDCEYKTTTCSVTPDQDGIFNVGIGDDCGSEINEAVFTENSALWLEVIIASETLTPRQPIRTVPFAINSETVQGYPISASESATANTILVMDAGGYVRLGENDPKLVSDTGTFTISGVNLSLEATNDLLFSDARVTDLPLSLVDTQIDAALSQGIVDAINDVYNLSSGSLFFSQTDNLIYPLEYWQDDFAIGGNSTASADILLSSNGNGIFTGSLAATKFEDQSNSAYYLDPASTGDSLLTAGSIGIKTINPNADLEIQSDALSSDVLLLTALDGSRLGRFTETGGGAGWFEVDNAAGTAAALFRGDGGNSYINGSSFGIGDTTPDHLLDVAGNIGLDASGYINWGDVDGTAGYGFRDSSGTIQYKNSAGAWTDISLAENTFWQLNSGSLSPISLTTDINLGAVATNSAKISLAGSLDRGKSAVMINQTEAQDVFTASASGSTLFTIQNNGNLSLKNGEYISNNTDDLLVFSGNGGSINTDLTIDLDGNNPVLYSTNGLGIEVNDRLYIGANSRYFYDESGQLSFSDNLGIDSSVAIGTVNSTGNVGELITSSHITIDDLGEIRFRENSTNGTNYTGFVAPDNLSTDVIYTLPTADGGIGTVLTTDGLGGLTWGSNTAGDYWQENSGILSPASLQFGLNIGDTATTSAKVSIAGSLDRGQSALIVNQSEAQDIFTASASGSTRFTIDTDGNLDVIGNIGLAADNYINWGSVLGTSGYGFRDSGGTLQFKHDGGNWQDVGTGSGPVATGSGVSYWDLTEGSLSPFYPTNDVNFGDSASASAKVSIAGSLNRGRAVLIANQTEDQDILAASASGANRFKLTNSGDLDVYGSGNFGNSAFIDNYRTLQANQTYTDVGINTTYSQYLNQTRNETTLSGDSIAYGIFNNLLYRMNEGSQNGSAIGGQNSTYTDGTYTYSSLVGGKNVAYSLSTATSNQDQLFGAQNIAYLNSTGTITEAFGASDQVYNSSTGTIENAVGTWGRAYTHFSGANITNAVGVKGSILENENLGTITTGKAFEADCKDAATCYGLYINANDVDATTSYGIYGENGDWVLDADGAGTAGDITNGGDIILGEDQDAGIWYDGTDLKLNPQLVGSGDLYLSDGAFKTELGQFKSNVADGASSIAYEFNTINNLTTSGALIADFQNQGTSAFYIDKDGNISANGQVQLGNIASEPTALGSGSLYFNSTNNKAYFHNGTGWREIGEGPSFWQLNNGSLSPFSITTDINLGGTSTASAKVSIAGSLDRGKSALIINQTENQDIFTASSAGTTVTKIDNNGYIYAPRFVDLANSAFYIDPAATGTSLSIAGEFLSDAGTFKSGVTDSASAIGYTFDTTNTLSTTGALIADFRNSGTSLLTIDKDGNLWAKGNIYSDKGFGMSMKNIGVALEQYDLVVINTTEDNTDGVPRMSATSSANSKAGFGVVQEACTTNSTCKVVFQGETLVNMSTSTNRGDYIYSSGVLGKAGSHTKQFDGMLGIATSTDISDPYQVEMIFLHQPSVDKLRVADKNRMHADYREAAIDYTYANETNYYDIDENIRKGLYFDTFQDKVKIDSSNSDSLVDDVKQRAGLFGGITMNNTNTDSMGNTLIDAADANDVYYYDRTGGSLNEQSRKNAGVSSSGVKESEPQVLVELGIDPNWYNGVTLDSSASAHTAKQPPANLSTSYNGSLIKASGRYATGEEDGSIIITIKSDNEATDSANPSITFDWATNYDLSTAEHSGSNIIATKGTPITLETGTNDIEITFSQTNYHAGDRFKIASWYLEPVTLNDRGDKQIFPERTYIIPTDWGLNIIDADTNKLWMRFTNDAAAWDTADLVVSFSPTSVYALNGFIFAGHEQVFHGLVEIDLGNDSGLNHSVTGYGGTYRGDIAQRNDNKGYNGILREDQIVLTTGVNDIHAAVVPNHPTKDVTVSGWGYVLGNNTTYQSETVQLPYKFNNKPNIQISSLGTTTVKPTSQDECNTALASTSSLSWSVTNTKKNSFTAGLTDSESTLANTNYYCYSWTTTAEVSPKMFTATSNGDGVYLFNNTDEESIRITQTNASADSIWLTTEGDLYYEISYTLPSTEIVLVKKFANSYDTDLTATEAYDYHYDKYGTTNATIPAPLSLNGIKNIYVTEETSTYDHGGNTLYIGQNEGMSVIQENNYDGNKIDSYNIEKGSVKQYTKDYISEEMIGDIRGMWPLNGNNTASDFEDVSIKGNDLTGVNITAADAVSGVRGEAYDFDGSTEYLTCSDANCPSTDPGTADFSMGAWIKPDVGLSNDMIIRDGVGVSTDYYQLRILSGKLFFSYSDGTTESSVSSDLFIDDGQWHHVIAIADRDTGSYLYVDGQMVGSNSTPAPLDFNNTNNFSIGASYNDVLMSTNAYFDGVIDEVFMTAEALNLDQIKRIYETGKRALEGSHGINDYKNNLDEDGTGNGTITAISDIGIQMNDKVGYGPYAYVAVEDGDGDNDGYINKIDLGSDTVVQYMSSTTDPGIPDNDATSIAVSNAGLELIGMNGVGAVNPGINSNSNNTSGTYYSDTVSLPEGINNAYAWINEYVDSDCPTCSIKVYASNDGGSNWVPGQLTSTDNNQSPPEKEYLFSFSNQGSSLKFKVDFTRDSNKSANVYIEKYGIAWFNDDNVIGDNGGGVFTQSGDSVADGSYVEITHGQGTNDIISNGWLYNSSTNQWEDISNSTASAYSSQFSGGNLIKNYPSLENAKAHDGGPVKPDWWDAGGATATLVEASASAESVSGKNETVLKLTGSSSWQTASQDIIFADEPLLTESQTKVSAGVWVYTTAGSTYLDIFSRGTATLLGRDGTNVNGEWTYLSLENIDVDTIGLWFQVSNDTAGAVTYIANPQLNVGPKVKSWNERQLRYVEKEQLILSAWDPTTNWDDINLKSVTSNLTAKVDMKVHYQNLTSSERDLFLRRNGSNSLYGAIVAREHLSYGFTYGSTTVLTDANQIIELHTANPSDTESVYLYLAGYYEWDSGQAGMVEGGPFQIVQVDEDTVRLYNHSGSNQQLRLDVATGAVVQKNGTVSLAPLSADVDASKNTNSIWINKTDESGNLLKLQNDAVDRFAIDWKGNATLSGRMSADALKLNTGLALGNNATLDTSKLSNIDHTLTDPGSTNYITFTQGYNNITTSASHDLYGTYIRELVNASIGATLSGDVVSLDTSSDNIGSGDITGGLYGIKASAKNVGAGSADSLNGLSASFRNSGTVGDAVAISASGSNYSFITGDTIGLRIYDMPTATGNDYGIYQAGADDTNYFAGNVTIGSVSPSGDLLSVAGDTNIDGHLALGNNAVASSTRAFYLNEMLTDPGVTVGAYITKQDNITVNASHNLYGLFAYAQTNPSTGITQSGSVIGSQSYATNMGTGSVTGKIWGIYTRSINSSTGSVGTLETINAGFVNNGTASNVKGIDINGVNTGTITGSAYGLYINDMPTANVAEYGIYQAGASDSNYFAGSVGIGIQASGGKLRVNQENANSVTAIFDNTSLSTNQTAFMNRTQDVGTSNEYFMAFQSNYGVSTDNEFILTTDGNVRADIAFTGGGADVAEMYYIDGPGEPGDLVQLSTDTNSNPGENMERSSSKPYSHNVVGVISTNPGLVAGGGDVDEYFGKTDPRQPVALAGRVPVKVSLENGPIKIGDHLTSSSTPGVAMKATASGKIIGQAMEDYDGTSKLSNGVLIVEQERLEISQSNEPIPAPAEGTGKIMVFVYTSYKFTEEDLTPSITTQNLSDRVDAIKNDVTAMISNISDLIVKTITADRVTTDTLEVDLISPIPGNDLTIALSNNENSGTLDITGENDEIVAQIDNQGNTSLLGQLLVGGDLVAQEVITSTISADVAKFVDASISGQLDTTSARIEKLESKLAQIENLDAQTANIVNATISGTLFADDISEFGNKVAAAIEEPTLLEKLFGTAGTKNTVETIDSYFANHDSFVTEIDTSSVTRLSLNDLSLTADDLVIDATAVYVDQYFDVNGSAYIAESLGIGQSLVISDSMYITAGSIEYAPTGISKPTLNIQPSGNGILSLMAGLFTLDDSGLAQVNGDLSITGNLRVNQTLLTNVIAANNFDNPFQVQLATMSGEVLGDSSDRKVKESRFEIVNELGVPVATISAQGKANFSSGIGIGSERLESTDSAQIESQKTSGTANIKAGSSEIVIKSPIVSEESLIYVTPLGSTSNKVLYVKEIINDNPETTELESYFKVGFDSNVDNDVRFNWWIVN